MFEYLLLFIIGLVMYYNTQLTGIQILVVLLICLLIISMFNIIVMEPFFPHDGLKNTSDPNLVTTDQCGNPSYETSSTKVAYDTNNEHQKMTNLTDLPPPPHEYIASYRASLRGQNYLDSDVNVYKSPIETGHPTDGWDCNPCIKKLEYRRYNNYHNDYNMEGPLSATCANSDGVQMNAPKNSVNLFKAPDCQNEDSVSYY